MSSKSPAFQFYPQDWLSSPRVTMMSLAEQGAYIRLLCFDWMSDGISEKDIFRLSGLDEIPDTLIECFIAHPKKQGFLTNERLLKERKKQKDFSSKKKRAGKAGAIKRWGKETKGDSSAIAHPIAKDSFSSSSSSSNNNKKNKQKKCVNDNAEKIYQSYPRKVGKGTAIKAIIKAMQSISYEELLQAVREFATTQIGKDPQYIPHCSTWMNGQRWLDEPDSNQQSEVERMSEEKQKAAREEWRKKTERFLEQ